MKIKVSGDDLEAQALRRRFILQGEEIVENGEALCFDKNFFYQPVIPEVIEGFFGECSKDQPGYFLSRYWDSGKFHQQTIIGVPVYGMMNEGLGANAVTAIGIKYTTANIFKGFEHDFFQQMLNSTKRKDGQPWSGFVSFLFNQGNICSVEKSLPHFSLFPVLEGLNVRLSKFFEKPHSYSFKEWWNVGILLSRYPYPALTVSKPICVGRLSQRVEAHFWAFAPSGVQKESFYTNSTAIGIATAWSDNLYNAADRATWNLRGIECEGKQFRTDGIKAIAKAFSALPICHDVHDSPSTIKRYDLPRQDQSIKNVVQFS